MTVKKLVDARGSDFVTIDGSQLRKVIREELNRLEEERKALLTRMNNELPSKEEAVNIMIAVQAGQRLNERALFFKAGLDRLAFITNELVSLNTLGACFDPNEMYQITVADARRFGI